MTARPPITLHLGAHRAGAARVQAVLDRDAADLRARGIAAWTSCHDLLGGIVGDPGWSDRRHDVTARRAAGRIAMLRSELAASGATRLILSDPAALGNLRENLMLARLYPSASGRMRRLSAAVPGIARVCLCIRSPDDWWRSAVATLTRRGFAPPDRATLEAVSGARRGWRRVIEDVAAALPEAELLVWSHEELGDLPGAAATFLTGVPSANAMSRPMPVDPAPDPFHPVIRARLRAAHADDIAWLRDGADGCARYMTGEGAFAAPTERGDRHDRGIRSEAQMDAAG